MHRYLLWAFHSPCCPAPAVCPVQHLIHPAYVPSYKLMSKIPHYVRNLWSMRRNNFHMHKLKWRVMLSWNTSQRKSLEMRKFIYHSIFLHFPCVPRAPEINKSYGSDINAACTWLYYPLLSDKSFRNALHTLTNDSPRISLMNNYNPHLQIRGN